MFGKFVFLSFFMFFTTRLFGAQYAEVVTDGAMVYKRADFGSDILGYLRAGKQVKVSNKPYGAFYRVKLRQGIVGYVSDVDVRPSDSSKLRLEEASDNKRKTKSKRAKAKPNKPILAGKFIGGGLSMLPFVDRLKIGSTPVSKSSNTSFLMFKYSSPLAYLDGVMISDFNAGISVKTPSLYQHFSDGPPSGYVLIADYSLLKPVYSMTKTDYSVYWGAGLTAIYTSVSIGKTSGSEIVAVPASELRIGAVFMAGASFRVARNWAFKLEPKLYWEKEKYVGLSFSMQKSY